jgi:putative effector of murein hydrolase LrgA (UPF0299 family)
VEKENYVEIIIGVTIVGLLVVVIIVGYVVFKMKRKNEADRENETLVLK